MRIKDSFTSVRVQVPGRRVALASLIVAAITLAVSLYLGPPIAIGFPGSFPAGLAALPGLVPLVGGGLPLLALVASGLCLFGAPAQEPPPPAAEASPTLLAGLREIVADLNGVLEKERAQAAALQRTCAAATSDAAAASARMARIADTAIDAEARLASGVAHAEKALRQPAAIVTWAAEATQRVERALPELAEMIKTGLGSPSDPAFDAAAERLTTAVDGAVATFRSAIEDAAGRIEALGDISAALRRDAVALDMAGREIATAGATVVARANEAVGQVETAVASLPDAVASVANAAEQVKATLDDASSALRADGDAVRDAGEAAAGSVRSAEQAVGTVADGIRSAVDQIAAVIATVDAVRLDTASMAELTEKLREAASVLVDGTGSLDQAGQRVAGRLDYACEEIWSATNRMTAQVADACAPLPAAAAAVTSAADLATDTVRTAGQAISRASEAAALLPAAAEQAAHTLAAGKDSLDEAARTIVARLDTIRDGLTSHAEIAAEQVTSAAGKAAQALAETLDQAGSALSDGKATLQAAGKDVSDGLNSLRETITSHAATAAALVTAVAQDAANSLSATLLKGQISLESAGQRVVDRMDTIGGSIADQAARTLAEAAAVLCADSAALDASGKEAMQAAAAILKETEAMRAAGDAIAMAEGQAIARVAQSAESAAGRLAAMIAEADSNRGDAASLGAVAATLEHVSATLADSASMLDSAGQRVAAAGESVAERLADGASHTEAVLRGLPEVAAEIATAAEQLTASGGAMTGLAQRADAAIAALDATARQLASAGQDIGGKLDRIADIAQRETDLPGAVERLHAAVQALPGRVPPPDLDGIAARIESVIARLPGDLSAGLAMTILDVAGTDARQLDTIAQRLETIIARLPAEDLREAQMASLSTLSGDIGESVRRVESALAEHNAALAGLVAAMQQTVAAAPGPGHANGNADGALVATLNHLDGVAAETEQLLRQTEALAEAVMTGRAPGLSRALAERAPGLLAGVETTTKRLRSVATALALASDGPQNAKRAV